MFKTSLLLCCAGLIALLVACGGVGSDGTGPSTDTLSVNTVNVGVVKEVDPDMLKVNDTSYSRTQASVVDGFGQALMPDDLRLGMWVEVSGTTSETSGTATAAMIRVHPAARGVVTDIDTASFTVSVLGTTISYSSTTTILEGFDAAAQIKVGDALEVHGPLGQANGAVEASRIERLPANTMPQLELRGRVSNLDAVAQTLTLGRQNIAYANANLTLRGALANGQVVRVRATAPPQRGQAWKVQALTSDQPLQQNLNFVYVEGTITDWTPGPKFVVEGFTIDATVASRRESATGNGQRVAVLGRLENGVIFARSLALSLPGQSPEFVVGGAITDVQSTTSFTVRGVMVDAKSAVFEGGSPADLKLDKRVRATGTISASKLIASKVEIFPKSQGRAAKQRDTTPTAP